MSIPNPHDLVPLRWPATWKGEGELALLSNTPVNCILDAPEMIAGAARKRGLTALSKAEAAATVTFLADTVWPSVKMARRGEGADSGPTGAPWVDANGWAIQLARAQNPEKPVWVEAPPPADRVLDDSGFVLAAAEPAVFGGRWVVTFDEAGAAKLAAGDPAARQRWRRLTSALDFFGQHRAWDNQAPRAGLAVISDFAGPNEFMAKEFLNLAARRNLACRICPRATAATAGFSETQAVLYLDEQPPAAELSAALLRFVRGGGTLIARKASPFTEWAGKTAPAVVPGYEMGAPGKGKVVFPSTPWEDPWVVAQETRILVGRRTDPIRLFNTGIMAAYYTRSKDGAGTVHLLNYSRRPQVQAAAIAPADSYGTATAVSAEFQEPKQLKIEPRENAFSEIAIPPFAVHMAVELGR